MYALFYKLCLLYVLICSYVCMYVCMYTWKLFIKTILLTDTTHFPPYSYHSLTQLNVDVITAVVGPYGKHFEDVSIADQVKVSVRKIPGQKSTPIVFTCLLG